nr:metal-binding protein ZinT [Devosia crocina]
MGGDEDAPQFIPFNDHKIAGCFGGILDRMIAYAFRANYEKASGLL